jgi:hypothetical protein
MRRKTYGNLLGGCAKNVIFKRKTLCKRVL